MLKLAGIKFVLKHNPLIFVGQSPISIYASAKLKVELDLFCRHLYVMQFSVTKFNDS